MILSMGAAPLRRGALLAAFVVAACAAELDQPHDPGMEPMSPESPGDEAPGGGESEAPGDEEAYRCPLGEPGVYTPFAGPGRYPLGPVDELPWSGVAPRGARGAYPAGAEDFRGYGSALPKIVECSDEKRLRSYLDVTAGCLEAVEVGPSAYTRGVADANRDGYFRALALGYAPGESVHPNKWTDQGVEYRFLHHGRTGRAGNPGFKAFVRYRSEDDLYVASWRFDGVVQIQRKVCGEYEALAVLEDFDPPSPNVWHSLRFEATGDELSLYLDDDLVLTATSHVLSWGTAGIRIDSADRAYIDDWAVYQP